MRLIATASDIIAAAQAAAPRLPIGRADGVAMPPTIDGNGRMHAPCDGYEINGTVYRGGEYIGESGGVPRIRKIKATMFVAECRADDCIGRNARRADAIPLSIVDCEDIV